MTSEIIIKARTANGKLFRKITKNSGFQDVTNFITEGVKQAIVDSPTRDVNKLGEKMARKMEASVRKELSKIPDLVTNLVNSGGPARSNRRISPTNILGIAGTDDFSRFGRLSNITEKDISRKYVSSVSKTLEWKALARATVQSKMRKKRRTPDSFFKDKGNLQRALKRFSENRLKAYTGGVRVSYIPLKDRKNTKENLDKVVGNFTIEIFPRLKSRTLPFLRSGKWSDTTQTGEFESQFFGKSTVMKLTNGRGTMRPLMQPVVSAVLAFRVPGAIIRGAQRSVIGRRT